jgi:hypothetical protein
MRAEVSQLIAEHLTPLTGATVVGHYETDLANKIIALIFTKAQTMPMTAAAQTAGCLQYIKALLYGRE